MAAGLSIALAAALAGAAPSLSPGEAGGGPAGAADPCVGRDALGRAFRTCFDPGRGLELSYGAAFGGDTPVGGGASDLRLAWRWRRDLFSPSGSLEWLRDMSFLEGRGLFTSGDAEPRAAQVLLWRGLFVRHRASPFLLVPGPRIRLPFPFDVGLLVEAGGASWDRARPREALLSPVRSALLLDVGGHGVLRRLAFGPEVAWTVRVSNEAPAVHGIVPFTAGVVDARAESRDGLAALAFSFRGGSSLSVPGGAEGFAEATLAVERVVFAVNDRPFALYAEGSLRGGGGRGRSAEAGVGLRAGFGR
ncbi:MAG TPA: hypothetical protein VIV57_24580 [Anaeromyxobacter sp.]